MKTLLLLLLWAGTAQGYTLVGPKPFDAQDFASRYRRETFGMTHTQLRGLQGKYGMLLAAAAEPDQDWLWMGLELAPGELVTVLGPGAFLFGTVRDQGMLLPLTWEAADWEDSSQRPLYISLTSDAGHEEKGQPIRLLVRVPKGTRAVVASVDTARWKGGRP